MSLFWLCLSLPLIFLSLLRAKFFSLYLLHQNSPASIFWNKDSSLVLRATQVAAFLNNKNSPLYMLMTITYCDKERFKRALIIQWQRITIINMCFIVYKPLSNSLLPHLNKFPFLFMPWGFANTGFIPEEGGRQYTQAHTCTHSHSSLLCVGSVTLT